MAVRNPVAAFLRLVGWLWVLARHDALIPREVTPLLPVWTRPFARFVQMLSGRDGREGRPGQRLGKAFEHLGPVAIKLGQVLATRADIFGIQFARDLGVLNLEEGVAQRATFIVDPDNVVQHVYVTNLNVGRNPQDTLRVLDALQTDELCPCNRSVGGETLKAA